MIKVRRLSWGLIFALVVTSCSIELEQNLAVTTTPSTKVVPTTSTTSPFPITQVPVAWASLNLAGKLVYISTQTDGDTNLSNIQVLDLKTGVVTTIFSAPTSAWIYYAAVSPDAKWLVMSYAPPSEPTAPSNRSLYILSLNEPSSLQPLFEPPTPDDHYTQAEWSPDGKYIYLVHYNSNIRLKGLLDPVYDITRIRHPDGQPEKIADNAFWPRISSDSSKLVYVSIDETAGSIDPGSGKNYLFLANADGSNARQLSLSGPVSLDIIDAPIFAPNGDSILFSVPSPTQAYQPNILDLLMGVQVVKAHSIPSDWWSVSINGGTPTQLTKLQTINLFASISPDQKHIASVSGEGIIVMDLDGSNLTRLISDPAVHGTVSWIP